jgi:hypothetical protein
VSAAIKALKGVETRQQRAFKNFAESWKAKRALVLSQIDGVTFDGLVTIKVCNEHDKKVRTEALANKASTENGGEAVSEEDLQTDD